MAGQLVRRDKIGATTANGAGIAADPTLTGGGFRGTLIAWRFAR